MFYGRATCRGKSTLPDNNPRESHLRLLRTNDRAVTAIHEAGHCLAHIHFGLDFDNVELAGDSGRLSKNRLGIEHEGRGKVHFINWNLLHPRSYFDQTYPELLEGFLREAEIQLACIYAGPIAQAKFMRYGLFGAILSGGQDDVRFAAKILRHWWPDEPYYRPKEKLAERRARRLIKSEQGWQVVQQIARRLLVHGAMDSDECLDIYVEVYGREPLDHNHPGYNWAKMGAV